MTKYCLILDQDPAHALALSKFSVECGLEAVITTNLSDARSELVQRDVVVAFIDLHGGIGEAQHSGLSLLEDASLNGTEALFMSEQDNPKMADEAIRRGASYFFCKPFDPPVIAPIFKDIVHESQQYTPSDSIGTPCAVDQFGFLRGNSKAMRKLYRVLRKAAQTDASLMIVGESGTGKELVAQTVHTLSSRSSAPFIAVNCAAIAQTLIESELFGHEKGAFSGAHSRHRGYFEQADGGTLFLDEITEMDPPLQTKLLRVLEMRKFRRLGSETVISVDVRVLSATNMAPEVAISEGKLREDLYYRLAQFPIHVPPLRQRGADITGLAQYFLNALNEQHNTNLAFSHEALDSIGNRSWPGNVRELKHYVERAYIMSDEVIELSDLPESISAPITAVSSEEQITVPIGVPLADVEQTLIKASLERNAGDKKATAQELGISLKTLYNRLRDYESQDLQRGATSEV